MVQAPAEHEPRADPRGHHHVDDVVEPPAGAEGDLRERAQVGVVVELDRDLEPAGELVARLHARPAGEDGRAHDSLVAVDRRREGDARSDDAGAVDARLDQRLGGQVGRRVQGLLGRLVDVELEEALGEDGGR